LWNKLEPAVSQTASPQQPTINVSPTISPNINIYNQPSNQIQQQVPPDSTQSSTMPHLSKETHRPQAKTSRQLQQSKEQNIIKPDSEKHDISHNNRADSTEGEQYPQWENFNK
jgi:hypothetical protein